MPRDDTAGEVSRPRGGAALLQPFDLQSGIGFQACPLFRRGATDETILTTAEIDVSESPVCLSRLENLGQARKDRGIGPVILHFGDPSISSAVQREGEPGGAIVDIY